MLAISTISTQILAFFKKDILLEFHSSYYCTGKLVNWDIAQLNSFMLFVYNAVT